MPTTITRRPRKATVIRKHATAARLQELIGRVARVTYQPDMTVAGDGAGALYHAALHWSDDLEGGPDSIELDDRRPEPLEYQAWVWLQELSLRLELAAWQLSAELRAKGQGQWIDDYYGYVAPGEAEGDDALDGLCHVHVVDADGNYLWSICPPAFTADEAEEIVASFEGRPGERAVIERWHRGANGQIVGDGAGLFSGGPLAKC